MGALSKFKSGMGRVKSAGLGKLKAGNVGSVGHKLIEVGTHAVLALASKNMDSVGPLPIKPDLAGGIVGLGLMTFGKGKSRKLGQAIVVGAVHAGITRFVSTTGFTLTQGPDGAYKVQDAA